MEEINFYNKQRKILMQFSNFRKIKDSVINEIIYSIIINFDFFKIDSEFCAESIYFQKLIDDLGKMYNNKTKHITFSPIDDDLIITFVKKDGDIIVKVVVKNSIKTGIFEFNYEIDQSFIPELINELWNINEIRN